MQNVPLSRKDYIIYIASPYTKGNVDKNVKESMKLWKDIFDAGFTPICPLWMHYQHNFTPLLWEECMKWCISILATANALVRFPGESKGADLEVHYAENIYGIPTFNLRRVTLEEVFQSCDSDIKRNKTVNTSLKHLLEDIQLNKNSDT